MTADTFSQKWIRRGITLPLHLALFFSALALAPVWLVVTFVVDVLARGRLALTRCGLFLTLFLGGEVVGVVLAFLAWCARPVFLRGDRWTAANFRLQCWWARSLFRGVQRLFGIQVDVEGSEACAQGPILLLMRHVSVGDTLFPAIFASDRYGIRLRYVLKRELLWDPCLDIVGQRLRNVFVRRGESGSDAGVVGELAEELGARDGVLIFPEGTRFTSQKRARVLERLEERTRAPATASNDAREAEQLRDATRKMTVVLPPRLGGTMALLDSAPKADVVICAHTGFEGISSLRDLYTGSLIGRKVRVRFWRVPVQDLPTARDERVDWLLNEWMRVDAFVRENQPTLPAR